MPHAWHPVSFSFFVDRKGGKKPFSVQQTRFRPLSVSEKLLAFATGSRAVFTKKEPHPILKRCAFRATYKALSFSRK